MRTRRAQRHSLSLARAPRRENTALFDRCGDALAEEDLSALATWRANTGDLVNTDILGAKG